MTSEYLGLHANRAHLAAREEGLDLGFGIPLGGEVGRRATLLRRGHAENEGGGGRTTAALVQSGGLWPLWNNGATGPCVALTDGL